MLTPGRSRVAIARCADYQPEAVALALDAALEPLGSMAAFVHPGQRVLLKVNLLSRAVPERAVTTHPELVRAIIRSVRRAGGVPTVGDSPGGPNIAGAVKRIWADTGIGAVCAEEGVDLILFDDDVVRVSSTDSAMFPTFTIGRAVAEADVVITIPKLKTHGFMMFTGAVKNLFGCIPGLEKAQYHLRVPDRDDFAAMLVDLMTACSPSLAIMDAIVGMEGEGPAGGTPRHIGGLLASADPVSLDIVASAIAGLDPLEVYTNKAAIRRGLAPSSLDDIEVIGTPWRDLAPEGFVLPAKDPTAGLPSWLAPRLRAWTTARPYLASPHDCTRCRMCEQVCPVGAVSVDSERGPVFHKDDCIRCYCCQELCPPQAIGLKTPWVARVATRGRDR